MIPSVFKVLKLRLDVDEVLKSAVMLTLLASFIGDL